MQLDVRYSGKYFFDFFEKSFEVFRSSLEAVVENGF